MQFTDQQIRQLKPMAWKLANPGWETWITAAGTGFAQFGDAAISCWHGDPTKDVDGFYVFLRDLEQGILWSPTLQPLCSRPVTPQGSGHIFLPQKTAFQIQQNGLSTEMAIRVPLQWPMELRRVRLTNSTDKPRRVEILPYLELVLQSLQEYKSHPAFSKMFIETNWDQAGQALWARRRPRAPQERGIAAALFYVGQPERDLSAHDTQSCRAAFIGRGRSVSTALGLIRKLPQEPRFGGVLDPIFNLRVPVVVRPGESCDHYFGLAASEDPDELIALTRRFQHSPELCSQIMEENRSECEPWDGMNEESRDDQHQALMEAAYFRATTIYGTGNVNPPHFEPLRSLATADPISTQVPRASEPHSNDPLGRPTADRDHLAGSETLDDLAPMPPSFSNLQFENTWGGFSADGKKYQMHLRLEPGRDMNMSLPPMPWTHIIANDRCGAIVSERGSVSAWYGNSRECRLTPWFNDPICDPHGEAFYIQDLDSGVAWSPTPGPLPYPSADYQVTYQFGKVEFWHSADGLCQSMEIFIPESDPVKITRWRIKNDSEKVRRIRIWGYLEWILGNGVALPQEPLRVSQSGAVILAQGKSATDPARAIVGFSAWLAPSSQTGLFATTDRIQFLGRFGTMESPSVLIVPMCHRNSSQGSEAGATTNGLPMNWDDPQRCAAFEQEFRIESGESIEIVAILGGTASIDEAFRLVQKYNSHQVRSKTLCEIEQHWKARCQNLIVSLPSQPLNILLNGWLMYQNVTCRLRARSSYYQGGGAFGFRDQLQDSLALLHTEPALTRAQILLHAAHQFVEGDVLHWWHPPDDRGVRTRFSDDLHWLPYAALEYIDVTGDDAIWDEEIPFLEGDHLALHEQERFLWPRRSAEAGTLWEHCRRALHRAFSLGIHDLPLMGCGDWNDGMSRVGAAGRGESVWLAFFLAPILEKFSDVCRNRGELHAEQEFRDLRTTFITSIEKHAWDGRWYRRAFLDNGMPIGSQANSECRIDALVQAWAALSHIAPKENVAQALDEVEKQLVDREHGIIRLLTPPFQSNLYDVGYIRGYVPGIRENGGQYTHGVLWFIRALAENGHGTKAWQLLEMMTPIWHTRSAAAIATYKTEPYVIAADIYGSPPHVGRGGWTWYTGSAGWMYRIAIETLLGISIHRGTHLRIDPRLPKDGSELNVTYRIPGVPVTMYRIEIHNPQAKELGIRQVFLDGAEWFPKPAEATAHGVFIPICRDKGEHHVRVIL